MYNKGMSRFLGLCNEYLITTLLAEHSLVLWALLNKSLLSVIGRIKGAGHPDTGKTQPLSNSAGYVREDLGLADSK